MIRAVFDTNILVSARLSLLGNPARCLALAHLRQIQSITCADILDEFKEKLISKFDYESSRANEAVFERAVGEVTAAARSLLASLETNAAPRNREIEMRKAQERSRKRFA